VAGGGRRRFDPRAKSPHLFFQTAAQTPPACRTSILPKVNPPTTRAFEPPRRHLYHALGLSLLSLLCWQRQGDGRNHGDGSRRADRLLAVGDRSLWHARYVGPQFESSSHHMFLYDFWRVSPSIQHVISRSDDNRSLAAAAL
jgi:hypothetical protein